MHKVTRGVIQGLYGDYIRLMWGVVEVYMEVI